MFHINLLTPYQEMDFHGPNFVQPPPDLIDGEEEYEIEEILDARCNSHYNRTPDLGKV